MRYLLTATLCLLLSGCVTAQRMSTQQSASLKGKRLVVGTQERGHLDATTGTKIFMFGAFTGIAGIADGNRIINKYNIPDPAEDVAQKMGQYLANHFSMTLVNAAPYTDLPTTDYTALAAKAPQADYLLYVASPYQRVAPYTLDLNNYHVTMNVIVMLLDAKTKEKIYTGICAYQHKTDDRDASPSWDDLFDNEAAGYKQHIAKAQQQCLSQFMSELK